MFQVNNVFRVAVLSKVWVMWPVSSSCHPFSPSWKIHFLLFLLGKKNKSGKNRFRKQTNMTKLQVEKKRKIMSCWWVSFETMINLHINIVVSGFINFVKPKFLDSLKVKFKFDLILIFKNAEWWYMHRSKVFVLVGFCCTKPRQN